MGETFEHISFLARSSNRADVLAHLSSSPATQRELLETTGASRMTVGRILTDMTERRWIIAEGDTYRTTPTGDLVCAEFERLRKAVAVGEHLRDVVEWFPREWLSFDLRHLDDAEVAVPTQTEPTAPVRLVAECMADATHVRLVAQSIATEVLAVQREQSETAGLTAEVVMSESLVETVAEQDRLASQMAEMMKSGALEAYRYPGAIPGTFGVFDGDRVGFAFVDDVGRPSAALTTDDDAVLEWAEAAVDDYQSRAEPLSASGFEE